MKTTYYIIIKFFNEIKNNKIIEFKNCEFGYVEHIDYIYPHPVSNYYFKLDDLSINVLLSLKWSLYGYYFMTSISDSMVEINKSNENIFNFLPKNINFNNNYNNHFLFIDDILLNNEDSLKEILNGFYNEPFYNENTKVCFKLKLNLADFLLLQNIYIPTLFFI